MDLFEDKDLFEDNVLSNTVVNSEDSKKEDNKFESDNMPSSTGTVTTFVLQQVKEPQPSDAEQAVYELCDNVVVNTFSIDIDGKDLYKTYLITKHLEDNQRRILTQLVVKHARRFFEDKLTQTHFIGLARAIVRVFSTEVESTYYIPYQKGSLAQGKLWYRFTYASKKKNLETKKLLEKALVLQPVTNSVESSTQPVINSTGEQNDSTLQGIENLRWLKTNLHPRTKVIEFWNLTYELRRENKSEYFEFPAVKKSDDGYELITEDFKKLYPEKTDSIKNQWNKLKPNFQKLFDESKLDPVALAVKLSIPNLPDGKEVVPFLFLLTHVIPQSIQTINKRDSGGKLIKKKPSKVEVQNSLFLHVVNSADLESTVAQQTETLRQANKTFQPTLIFIGPTISSIHSSYVLVNQVLYKCESQMKAIQVCFEIFFVLNLEYPTDCNQIWRLIQRLFYGIIVEREKLTTKFHTILGSYFTKA